ncbi:MAG: D-aminoacyl-tRNA deacylase [Pseudomonadota bacterium]|nr:D-aminoacyl-tRNA deacylase [Pseudomonadota bacterium]
MIALLQRVAQASVVVGGEQLAAIGPGLLVLLGVQKNDGEAQAQRCVERIFGYRVFADEAGKMNRSLLDIRGELLLVPQFTLAADTRSGMRPGFSLAATPAEGVKWFDRVAELSRQQSPQVQTGCFGADMKVALINDGPVTFWLETH